MLGGLLLAVPLAGCVSMGPNYDPAAVERLQPGADKAEVIGLLGRPTSTVRLADGQQQLMWVHSRGTMLSTGSARAVILKFDANGKYVGLVSSSATNLR